MTVPTRQTADHCGEWFTKAFSSDYLKIYQHRDAVEAVSAIASLLDLVGLPRGARCLDLACGFGRHLVQLNRHGLLAFGLDLSADLLEVAARMPECSGRLVRAEMRNIPLQSESLDFVFSFFSSFGYFASDEENERVIHEIARTLRLGGGFLLDFLNADSLEKDLVPFDEQIFEDWTLQQRRQIDVERNAVVKEMTIRDASGERTYWECVKLYRQGDFERFCAAAGCRPVHWWGDYQGAPFRPDSPRLILHAEKRRV